MTKDEKSMLEKPFTEFHLAMANAVFAMVGLMHPKDVIELKNLLNKHFDYGTNS